MFLLMCEFRGMHLVINSSYHTCVSFILSPFPYNITYSSWFATSYNGPSFMAHLSYHWQSRYPFVYVPVQEGTYNNPQYISRYYRNYCLGKWNTCLEGDVPPFPLPHLTMNGYFLTPKMIFKLWWMLLFFTQFAQIWCNEHWRRQHM
jgi:hypothetical protein